MDYKENDDPKTSQNEKQTEEIDFNIEDLRIGIENFNHSMEEGNPDETVSNFQFLTHIFAEKTIPKDIYQNIYDTEILIDLIDFIQMFNDVDSLILDAEFIIYHLIMNNKNFIEQFIINDGLEPILSILTTSGNEEVIIKSLELLKILIFNEKIIFILDNLRFPALIDSILQRFSSPDLLVNCASIIDLSIHKLPEMRKKFMDIAMRMFDLIITIEDENLTDVLFDKIIGSFEKFAFNDFESIKWILENNILQFCFEESLRVPKKFANRLIFILVGIFNSFPKLMTINTIEPTPEVQIIIEATKNLPFNLIIDLINGFIANADDQGLKSILMLLELAAQYDEQVIIQLMQLNFVDLWKTTMKNGDFKAKSQCIHLLYEWKQYMPTEMLLEFIDDVIIDIFEPFREIDSEISIKIYEICCNVFARMPQESELYVKLYEIIDTPTADDMDT